jgi:hypothetical protein
VSFLTPLYVLGLTAVIAPLVFHLIRRSPRGEVPFSSLMFLTPTPPRLTRRSRLDHLLLLLLRAAALCLLAFAFARPFLRQAARLGFGGVERRRVALLIDTSASMRRGDLWSRALEQANTVVANCGPADQLAVFAFDAQTRPLLSFQESGERDPAQRNAIARSLLAKLAPSWGGTNLGQALIDAVSAVEDVADTSEKSGRMPRRVVLISDLPQGSRLEALGDFEWPSDVDLELKTVADAGSNAGLAVLAESAVPEADASAGRRVRVFNDQSSRRERFELLWVDEHGKEATESPVDVYVPPGESRVARVPRPKASGLYRELRLRGDERGYDNAIYFADERREEKTVVYIGTDRADDPAGLLYYVKRVFIDNPRRTVKVVEQLPTKTFELEKPSAVPLVVVAGETSGANAHSLEQYVQGGGTMLFVATAPGRAETLAVVTGVTPWDVAESTSKDVMLGDIKFDHPLFAPLAGAQFNDFTKIRFWKHRLIKPESLGGDATVLARFETGDAAVIEKILGKGRLVVFASGWQRADSQLARSSKFVALMTGLMEGRTPPALGTSLHLVYDRVPMPPIEPAAKPLSVHHPDGTIAAVPRGDGTFSDTGVPGVYTVDTPEGSRSFAINLDPLESKTSALEDVTLEKLGCRLASHSPKPFDQSELRQMYNTELENRQKLWRALILAATLVLIVETWLAGRRAAARPRAHAEAMVT